VDIGVRSLETFPKPYIQEPHRPFGLLSNWWDRVSFGVIPKPRKDAGGRPGYIEDNGAKGGRELGSGEEHSGVRQRTKMGRGGTINSATSEQAEGWDVTRQVSLFSSILSFSFFVEVSLGLVWFHCVSYVALVLFFCRTVYCTYSFRTTISYHRKSMPHPSHGKGHSGWMVV
jgi:hypothetical protein